VKTDGNYVLVCCFREARTVCCNGFNVENFSSRVMCNALSVVVKCSTSIMNLEESNIVTLLF
jgi:hypothetical protein